MHSKKHSFETFACCVCFMFFSSPLDFTLPRLCGDTGGRAVEAEAGSIGLWPHWKGVFFLFGWAYPRVNICLGVNQSEPLSLSKNYPLSLSECFVIGLVMFSLITKQLCFFLVHKQL